MRFQDVEKILWMHAILLTIPLAVFFMEIIHHGLTQKRWSKSVGIRHRKLRGRLLRSKFCLFVRAKLRPKRAKPAIRRRLEERIPYCNGRLWEEEEPDNHHCLLTQWRLFSFTMLHARLLRSFRRQVNTRNSNCNQAWKGNLKNLSPEALRIRWYDHHSKQLIKLNNTFSRLSRMHGQHSLSCRFIYVNISSHPLYRCALAKQSNCTV